MKFIYTLAFVLFAQLCFSQQIPEELKGIDDDINLLIKRYKAVGLSIAVVRNDSLIYSKGFGYRDLENKLPVNENTTFPIGSATKAFTASVLGILESKNLVSLKEKPSIYIPNFQFYNYKMNNLITIEDLLSHKSGIGNQGTTLFLFPSKDKLKTVQRLKYLKPESDIKNSWDYSNMGYTLAGTIVEQVSNQTWDTTIRERIFEPLEMKNSYTTFEEMIKSNNFSRGYGMFNGKSKKVLNENFYSYSPAGAIKSTANDMANWMRVWLNKGMFNGHEVIPKAYIKKATSIQNNQNDNTYEKNSFLTSEGFGWRLKSWNGHYRIHHGGNTSGFSSLVVLFPFENIGVTVLTNQDNSLLPYMISDYICKKLLRLAPEPEYPVVVGDIYYPNNKKTPINNDKKPTNSLSDFCGSYQAKGFGKIKIVEKENKLFAIFPTYEFRLEHLNFNTFYMESTNEIPQIMNPTFPIEFVNDTKGTIAILKLYSQKEPIEFYKE